MSWFFKKKKPEIIKLNASYCKANYDDNEVMFVRLVDAVKSKDTYFEVGPAHNAVVVKGGGDIRHYKSGTHRLFDNKREISNWSRGATVEIYYMPKEVSLRINWGTPSKIRYRDPLSFKVVEVGARGSFRIIGVANPEQFFRKVVGVMREFDKEKFREEFCVDFAQEFNDTFLKICNDEKLTYDQFHAKQSQIVAKMLEVMRPKFETYWGITIADLFIEGFNISAEDVERVEEVTEEIRREEREAEREKAAREQAEGERIFCPKCGEKCDPAAHYCANCGTVLGNHLIDCPNCGKKNRSDATFCTGCGTRL